MSGRKLIIGTRGSLLALYQARKVLEHLEGPGELSIVRTSGDRFKDKPLHEQDGVGFFTKEIEDQLHSGRLDLAVHSLKDLPIMLSPGLVLAAVLARDDPGDVLLVRPEAIARDRVLPLMAGARVGASSLRRQALLRSTDPQAKAQAIRGNVPTRIDKLKQGDHDAIVLARAGLSRLALDVRPLEAFDLNPVYWICAPGQGAIAVEARGDAAETLERTRSMDDEFTRKCVECERTLLQAYGGGCHAPFGAFVCRSETGFEVYVAAPGTDTTFRFAGFEAPDVDEARRAAEGWIRSGCPAGPSLRETEWIARPARPWC